MATAPERAAEYHAERGFSSTIARRFILETPAHAKAVLDGLVTFSSDAMTMGTAVHQILLRDDRVVRSPFAEYRTNEAKEWKAQVEADGQVPIKPKMWDEAREIAQHVNGQILAHPATPTPFTKGTAEHVIRFQSNGADCRSMLDWLRDDRSVIDDLKTTSDASPRKFQRHIFNMGYDIQAAFYVRAVEVAYGVTPVYRWVVVETRPPYPVAIYTLTERAMYAAQVKVDAAISMWNECTKTGVWPAYPLAVIEVDVPGWQAADVADAWADVELEEEVPF